MASGVVWWSELVGVAAARPMEMGKGNRNGSDTRLNGVFFLNACFYRKHINLLSKLRQASWMTQPLKLIVFPLYVKSARSAQHMQVG